MTTPAAAFVEKLASKLRIPDRQIFFKPSQTKHGGAFDKVYVQFYNVPLTIEPRSAEAENNRLMLTAEQVGAGRWKVELVVRGPSFGIDYKLRTKTTTEDGAAAYIADFLNRAAQKEPYGFFFDQQRERGQLPNSTGGQREPDPDFVEEILSTDVNDLQIGCASKFLSKFPYTATALHAISVALREQYGERDGDGEVPAADLLDRCVREMAAIEASEA